MPHYKDRIANFDKKYRAMSVKTSQKAFKTVKSSSLTCQRTLGLGDNCKFHVIYRYIDNKIKWTTL